MSLLTLVQKAFKRVGLTAPTAAMSSTDDNVVRMVELANEEGDELWSRGDWQVLVREETHTTLAAESQGLITTICGADFDHIKNETFRNRTKNRIWYPVDDVMWQEMKASGITGPVEYFRIRGNYLLTLPTPPAGETMAFEWVTKHWCESSAGAGQNAWAADDDVGRLDEGIMLAGLVWRWKKSQGLEYAEDFRQYEMRVETALTRDGAKPRLNMNGRSGTGSNVAQGSWNVL
jgi:hypothetical protein